MSQEQQYLLPSRVRVRQEEEDRFLIYYDECGFEANAVGARVIELCKERKRTYEELCGTIGAEFDAPTEDIRRDIAEFLTQLQETGLLSNEGVM
jgi:hypothetical protein